MGTKLKEKRCSPGLGVVLGDDDLLSWKNRRDNNELYTKYKEIAKVRDKLTPWLMEPGGSMPH